MDHSFLEKRAAEILGRFDPDQRRAARPHRPFMIEFFGTPKSGKTTMKEMLKQFFRRNGFAVSAPTEGAEVIEWARIDPEYNLRTCEYALGVARDRCFDGEFHVVIFDRALYDGIVRMEYNVGKGKISPEEHRAIEDYYLLPYNRQYFDLFVCLVAEPEIAMQRELARALTKKHGATMNPTTLAGLLDAHRRVGQRLGCANDPAMLWHDSSTETEEETAASILTTALDAFERRLARTG
jgi:hypothetical protein